MFLKWSINIWIKKFWACSPNNENLISLVLILVILGPPRVTLFLPFIHFLPQECHFHFIQQCTFTFIKFSVTKRKIHSCWNFFLKLLLWILNIKWRNSFNLDESYTQTVHTIVILPYNLLMYTYSFLPSLKFQVCTIQYGPGCAWSILTHTAVYLFTQQVYLVNVASPALGPPYVPAFFRLNVLHWFRKNWNKTLSDMFSIYLIMKLVNSKPFMDFPY